VETMTELMGGNDKKKAKKKRLTPL